MTPEALSRWQHVLNLDVNVFDTDCFGVMWHGAYIKWLEMGRVKLLEDQGLKLSLPNDPEGYVYPVVEQNLKYKNKAPFGASLTLTTHLQVDGFKLIFPQVFRIAGTEQITLEARTTVLVLDSAWKVQRRLPAFFTEKMLNPS